MNLPTSLVDVIDWVGAVLLHFVWQGAVIGVAYAMARPFFSSVSSRYRLGLSALAMLALCPIATLLYLWPSDVVENAAPSMMPAIGATVVAAADRAASQWHLRSALPWLVGAWSLGVLILASRSLWQWRRLVRVVREATLPSIEWQMRLQHLCARFGLRRHVRLLWSARAITPMLVGWIRPAVLLPASMMSGFTPAQVELIIAHELGHICRWDYLANLFQVVLEIVLFYHPVVHWISHDVRNARESCCDDLVLNVANGNPIAYARTLADLEEMRYSESVPAPALGASGGVLLARIRHIVGVSEGQERMPRTNVWPVLALMAAVALFAWRQQTNLPLPTPQELAVSLARIPAQSLALISGNLSLGKVSTVRSVQLAPAEPVARELEAPIVAIERPQVQLPMAERISATKNVVESKSLPIDVAIASPSSSETSTNIIDDAPLTPLHRVQPAYPVRASSSGIEGQVQLEFSVKADGSVTNVRTIHSTPAGVFDDAARAAMAEWRFMPGATGRHVQSFEFTLHNSEEKCRLTTGTMICRHVEDYSPTLSVNERR